MGVDTELPGDPRTVDDLVSALRDLKARSGMSYRAVHRELARKHGRLGIPELPSFNTVYRVFQPGRARLDPDLVVEIACVLHGEDSVAALWRLACQRLEQRIGSAALVDVSGRLPDEPAMFVGRRSELAEAGRLVDADARAIAFVGMAGADKTRLALRVAHALLPRFDRVLAVDLRGFDPQRPPADPTAVLRAFLRRLGMPADRAHRLDATAGPAAYQALLGEARTLIFLDNAASAAQIGPLLPTTTGSLALVTSRHELPELPDLDRVAVGPLPEPEAVELLRDMVGTDRVDGDPATASALTAIAGQLPLALMVIAARIATTPSWTLTDHLDRLRDRQDMLRVESAVELALDASHDTQPERRRRTLRLLALHPGADLTADTAAALAGIDRCAAVLDLTTLAEANLVQPNGPGRYTMHDLVRLHALSRGQDEEAPSTRRAALDRLRRHYERTAAQAMIAFVPHNADQLARLGPLDPAERSADRDSAKAWLDTEWHNLVATALHAAQHGDDEHVTYQSGTLARYMAIAGHFAEAVVLHTAALDNPDAGHEARDLTRNSLAAVYLHLGRFQHVLDLYRTRAPDDMPDPQARRIAHNNLGVAHMFLGQCAKALDNHRRGLAAARELGDGRGEAAVLNNLGLLHEHMGRYEDAVACLRTSAELAAHAGDLAGEASAHANLSVVYALTGRIDAASNHNDEALRIARQIGGRKSIGLALSRLGMLEANNGNHPQADRHEEEALRIAREIGDPDSESVALRNIGSLALRRGEVATAVKVLTEALDVTRQALMARAEADILNHVGHAMLATGALDNAQQHYRAALEKAAAIGAPRETAIAHQGIADASPPNSTDARHHGEQARRLRADIGFVSAGLHIG